MSKFFKDFTFMDKKFSSLSEKYIAVSLGDNDEKNLAMERDMETGETNRYRTEANYFYDKWSDNLRFELHIIKDPCLYFSQSECEISESEIREITRWLTSPHFPAWIKFEYLPNENNEVVNYFGWFKNIETYVVGGMTYGLKLYFECTTPFGYTDTITNEIDISSPVNLIISNESDELHSYCYPTIEIYPKSTGQLYICNIDDCNILDTGALTVANSDSLIEKLETYGKLKGYNVEYTLNEDGERIATPICNGTAVQFYLVDHYDNRTKCTAFYLPLNSKYYIIDNGFMYMTGYRDLPIHIDCKQLTINDDLGRMITYDKLGVSDVDSIYWLKLINGDNNLFFYGNCSITINHIEPRKVGE